MTQAISSSARFRQRKISTKQNLSVLYQRDIPDLEEEAQREVQQVETGVEKGEEEEHHLQEVINASNAAILGAKVKQVYIPTPDASKTWPEYSKYYTRKFVEPATYIRQSFTVEDLSGVAYCMDEEDEKFLAQMNQKLGSGQKCSEDAFEFICWKFESVIDQKMPYLSLEPKNIMSYEELSELVIEDIQNSEYNSSLMSLAVTPGATSGGGGVGSSGSSGSSYSFYSDQASVLATPSQRKKQIKQQIAVYKQFSPLIYTHYKNRKVNERHGKSIFPILKFEDVDKANNSDSDSDPYICFRRREVRTVRKTRRTDQQSSEKLRKLENDLEAARQLMELVSKREETRKEQLQTDLELFEARCKVKALKRKLKIEGDDEDLVTQKPPKKVVHVEDSTAAQASSKKLSKLERERERAEREKEQKDDKDSTLSSNALSAAANASSANVKLPASKIPDLELTTLESVLQEKDHNLRTVIKHKLKQRHAQDHDWVNYTDNPFVPFCDYFDPWPKDALEETRKELDRRHFVDERRVHFSSLLVPYPPVDHDSLKLPLSSVLGSSYTSRLEISPLAIRADPEGSSVVNAVDERNFDNGVSYIVPRRSVNSLRKRRGRGGRIVIDRRGFVNKSHVNRDSDNMDVDGDNSAYYERRIDDRFKYDDETHLDNIDETCLDASKLNGIGQETQSVRFSSMLLAKSYDAFRDAYHQRQRELQMLLQQRMDAQREQRESIARSNNANNSSGNGGSSSGANPGSSAGSNSGSSSSSSTGGAVNGSVKKNGHVGPSRLGNGSTINGSTLNGTNGTARAPSGINTAGNATVRSISGSVTRSPSATLGSASAKTKTTGRPMPQPSAAASVPTPTKVEG